MRLVKCALRECGVILAESLGTPRGGGIPMEVPMMSTLLVIVCALAIALIGQMALDP